MDRKVSPANDKHDVIHVIQTGVRPTARAVRDMLSERGRRSRITAGTRKEDIRRTEVVKRVIMLAADTTEK